MTLNEKATRQGGSLSTDNTPTIPQDGLTLKEFAWRQGVTRRTVQRWIARGILIVSRTPSNRPRIHGGKP